MVSINGISIDPEGIEEINEFKPLVDQRGVQYFFDKIYFVQRFIPDYASIVNPINKLHRKDQYFEWTLEAQR